MKSIGHISYGFNPAESGLGDKKCLTLFFTDTCFQFVALDQSMDPAKIQEQLGC